VVLFRHWGCGDICGAPDLREALHSNDAISFGARMHDYYPLINRAVAALEENTISARRRLYDHARSAQTQRLDRLRPPLSKNAFQQERFALEDAIHRVELETADRQRPHTHQATTETKLQDADEPLPDSLNVNEARTPTREKILSIISSAAMTSVGVVVMLVLAAIPILLVFGGVWASEKALDYLVWPVNIAFLLCVLIFLPLSLFRATRFVSAIGFLISSYIFGASAWFAGLLASYIYCGIFWTVLALFIFGIGVVPLGIIGAIFHRDWLAAGLLFGGLVLAYGARAMGVWMAAKMDSDRSFDRRLQTDGLVIRALRYCFSFSGRFNRTNFWIGYGIAFLMTMVVVFAIETIAPNNNIVVIVGGLWCILWFVSILSVATKRLHDLGYSGLLLLAFFATMTAAEVMLPPEYRKYESALGGICVILLGAAPGEKNPNRFSSGFQWKMVEEASRKRARQKREVD
jgi:uncharacterized membrane protein YhaH (DUF805 family)